LRKCMLTRLIDLALLDNLELKILALDVKGETNEPLNEIAKHKADEARACQSDRLQLPAGSAVLWNPQSPSGEAGTRRAGKLYGGLQRSRQLGKLLSDPDRRFFHGSDPYALDLPSSGRQPRAEDHV